MIRVPTYLILLSALGGCASAPVERPESVLLAMHPESLVDLELPTDSRGGEPPPERIPVDGPFRLRRVTAGIGTWEAPLPIRSRALFFSSAPEGMRLLRDGRLLQFRAWGEVDDTWAFDGSFLRIRAPVEEGAPEDLEIRYERAVERERALNRRWAGIGDARDFALRSLQQGETSRFGAFLPAPALARWRVTVPRNASFEAIVGLLSPEVDDLPASDGVRFRLTLEDEGETRSLGSTRIREVGVFRPFSADLGDWEGREVDLILSTEPGDDNLGDYLFVGEPRLVARDADPPRVLIVFIDTLRRDHVGFHGYERPTTPALDRFAETATVFDDVRAPAPWTLPSTRAFLIGDQPEKWGALATLPTLFAKAGWATAAFAGNIYLSSNFEMDGGWGSYQCVNWPRADVQVDRLMEWLDTHPDEPSLAMVHLMDVHLPYREPLLDRFRFAGAAPEGLLPGFARTEVVQQARSGTRKEVRDYVVARYDSSLRFVDREVARALKAYAGERDTVLVFSDHGEEFWDHESFEHGHTLYEELLRVIAVLRAPGMTPERVPEPVSLLDLLPTLLELHGIEDPEGRAGRSLLGLTRGEEAERIEFLHRRLAFGRPLYGREQWGVLHEQQKYTTGSGQERLFDLRKDPRERRDLVRKDEADLSSWRRKLAEGLAFPVHTAFRVLPDMGTVAGPIVVELWLPGGVRSAWAGADPTRQSELDVEIRGDTVVATWKGGLRGTRELFVAPMEDARDAAETLSLTARSGGVERQLEVRSPVPPPDGDAHRLGSVSVKGNVVSLMYAVVPQPPDDAHGIEGYDSESAAALKALGYLEDDP